MSIPTPFIQELLARTDIVEIVGRHVQLRKTGANFVGLCPFHGEKSPSFSVSPVKQFYHCFGCGKNGNAIGFLMDQVGMGFVEAVQELAHQYGLQVPEEDTSPQERARAAQAREQQTSLNSLLEQAAQAYAKHLKNTPRAVEYLKQRGLSGEIAKKFGLGYAPPGWRSLAGTFADYSDAKLVECGLLIAAEETEEQPSEHAKRYDRFRDRIMFPIHNVKGQCIGFGGRVLGDEKPKYLNSPETPVFSKGRELYGLFQARTALREFGYALVTEGYMDVVALAQLGFPNAVATLGTACTAEHVQQLFRFTDVVVFSFDGDAAGRRAARKALDVALPFASDTRMVKFLFLPAEHDPDSYVRTHGQAAFTDCIQKAVPLSRFMLEAASEGCDLASAEGRAHMASQAHSLWSLLPQGALKRQLLAEIAEQVQIDTRDLLEVWQASTKSYKKSSVLGLKEKGPSHDASKESSVATVSDALINPAHLPAPVATNALAATPQRTPPAVAPPRRAPGRMAPASRLDRVLRMLLVDSGAWDKLSAQEHALLVHLPPPHGPLFAWLESQLHEHGPQPWAALREGLHEHPNASYALQQLAQIPEGIEVDWNEVRAILDQLVRLEIQNEMKALALRAATDPAALEKLRQLSKLQKNS